MSTTDLVSLLDITHPVVQAPMAGTTTPALAATVTEAGGLGSLGLANHTLEQARYDLRTVRALTSGRVNVNLFCHRPAEVDHYREVRWRDWLQPFADEFGATLPVFSTPNLSMLEVPEWVDLLVDEQPGAVSFHFGLPPAAWLGALKASGAVLVATATSRTEARLAIEAGIDVLVAQGWEAGGHRGIHDPAGPDERLSTRALVAELAPLGVPVVAAGGLMDGADLAAVVRVGASGGQFGTAFLPCPEAATSPAHRRALDERAGRGTAMTSVVSGRPARGLVNRFMTDVDQDPRPPVPDYPRAYVAGRALIAAAVAAGSLDFGAHWAGTGVDRLRRMGAAELVTTLAAEMEP